MTDQRPDFVETVEYWLTLGGDKRIHCDSRGVNAYGCPPCPDPGALAYGSVTASTISTIGYQVANQLLQRLPQPLSAADFAGELERIRRDILRLCGLEQMPGLDIVFAASGTDIHLIAAQLTDAEDASLLVIMIEAAETGSGVPAALSGRHFNSCTALGESVEQNSIIDNAIEVVAVPSRGADGNPRPADVVDAEVEALASDAIHSGRKVLLVLTDPSKTGLIAPSPACVLNLQKRFPSMVETLVDACQLRIAPSTLRAYLEQGFPVAITGSKFLTGPAFSGAILIPQVVAQRWRKRPLAPALCAYSARGDWPKNWAAVEALPDSVNVGMLLRWEAALAEWRRFYALPETAIAEFTQKFATAICARLASDSAFEPLPANALDRSPVTTAQSWATQNWDSLPTIFPFLLRSPDGVWVSREEMKRIYERLRSDGYHLGQPVICGVRDGVPVSALRLSLSARLITDALSPSGRGADAIITEALTVLDNAARSLIG